MENADSNQRRIRWAIFIGIALLACVVRLPRLGERPMHTDESINAYIIGQLLEGNAFQYDPRDRHGPALYALALPIARVAGENRFSKLTESTLRLSTVLVGAATVLLMIGLARAFGLTAAAIAAVLLALGPLPVYYNRYFIHETPFVMATFGCILSTWTLLSRHQQGRLSRRASVSLGGLTGTGAAIMLACKETAVLHFAALGVASLCWFLIPRRDKQSGGEQSALRCPGLMSAIEAALLAFLVVIVLAFTWGGTHWEGLTDLFKSIPHLTSRAAGEGHEKPFWYYLTLLGGQWSGVVVLALGLVGAAAVAKQAWGKSLLVYTLLTLALYSAIPYKTPWLALNLWLPLAILAGCGVAFVWQRTKGAAVKGTVVCALMGWIVLLGCDTWQRAFARSSDERNPFAYSHTVEDLLRLPERLDAFARTNRSDLRIAVVAADAWPLPWYLRRFPQVGFWQPGQDPGAADVYITSPEAAEALASRLQNRRPEYFGLRPDVLIFVWLPPDAEVRHE